ncbi:ORF2 [Cerdocyon thous torque teno virus 1]|nr:ORF2 [Cerdocyon thous torque teno virus 1]
MPKVKAKVTWTPEQDREKRHQAAWLRHCAWTHDLWCHCHCWTSHIRHTPCTTSDEEAPDAVAIPPADGGEEAFEAAMVAAAEAAEATGEDGG